LSYLRRTRWIETDDEIKANKLFGNMHQPQRNLPYNV
jgi:hypothetical protein